MKRISFILLGGLVCITAIMAQPRNFTQRGMATQEFHAEGLSAAHPVLPIHSKARITNTVNGEEIEVTISGRIPASQDRIIDLSPDAWWALGLHPGAAVVLTTNAPLWPISMPTSSAAEPFPEAEPVEEAAGEYYWYEPPVFYVPAPEAAPPQVVETAPKASVSVHEEKHEEKQPFSITVNTFVTTAGEKTEKVSEQTRAGSDTEFMAWLASMIMDAREAREFREARESRESREARELREAREREFERNQWAANVQPPPAAPPVYYQPMVQQPMVQQPMVQQPPVAPPPPAAPPPAAPPVTFVAENPAPPAPAAPPPPVVENPPPVVQPPAQQPPAQQPPAQQSFDVVAVIPAGPPPASPVSFPQALPQGVEIIPGLPDPKSNRMYRLQVGFFSTPEAAERAVQQIKTAGFAFSWELSGSIYRVFAVNIPAADVYFTVHRLSSTGLRQFWVMD
ncbi:MAG: SPOR domain-containing protein [Treponema sp.]|nr:SPOR domain-containing protein [Treponema sp.]